MYLFVMENRVVTDVPRMYWVKVSDQPSHNRQLLKATLGYSDRM
jgi:hypothetical protein